MKNRTEQNKTFFFKFNEKGNWTKTFSVLSKRGSTTSSTLRFSFWKVCFTKTYNALTLSDTYICTGSVPQRKNGSSGWLKTVFLMHTMETERMYIVKYLWAKSDYCVKHLDHAAASRLHLLVDHLGVGDVARLHASHKKNLAPERCVSTCFAWEFSSIPSENSLQWKLRALALIFSWQAQIDWQASWI